MIKITNKTENLTIGCKIRLADSFFKRFRGLILTPEPNENEGLLITPCNSVHMMFMSYPIDAVFLDSENTVKAIYKNLRPWLGITKIYSDVKSVLELKTGMIEKKIIKIGYTLNIEDMK